MNHENGSNSDEKGCGTIQAIWAEYSDRLDPNVYIINAVVSIIFSVPTVATNLILLIAVWRTSSLRTPSNILICALASTDLCVGVVEVIFAGLLLSMLTNAAQTIKCVFAAVSRVLANLFAEMSFLAFTAISVDKLLMVHLHLRYNTLVTIPKITFTVAAISCLSGAIAALNFLSIKLYTATIVAINCTCFIVAFISYVQIYRTVIRHQKQIYDQAMAVAGDNNSNSNDSRSQNSCSHNSRNHNNCSHNNRDNSSNSNNTVVLELSRFKKRTFSMMVIYCIFLLSYFPYIVIIVIMMAVKQESTALAAAKIYSISFIFLNSLVNPLLISSTMREIRNAMKNMLNFTK